MQLKQQIRQLLTPRIPRQDNICMFHMGRSGSTVVTKLIGQHPEITWDGELLRGPNLMSPEPLPGRALPPYAATRWFPFAPLEFIRERTQRKSRALYGFETKFYHIHSNGLTLPGYVAALRSLGYRRFIVLKRLNYLRKIVSSVLLNRSGESHLRQGEASLKRVFLDVRCIDIDRQSQPLVRFLEQWDDDFRAIGRILAEQDVLELSYEADVMDDPRIAYRRICEWLGIQPQDVSVELKRTNPFPLAEMIENLDEVRQVLAGTPFAWMLEEDAAADPSSKG